MVPEPVVGIPMSTVVGVADVPSGLSPRGPQAAGIASLWWILFALATVVVVVVLTILVVSMLRQRTQALERDVWTGEGVGGDSNLLIILGGVAVPGVLIVLLAVLMLSRAETIRVFGATPEDAPLIVEVVAHQFWWDVRYPDAGVRTANEIVVPVDRPVEVRLASADVIHSFWAPQLGPKMDMVPGEETLLRIEASEPGVYRGVCTEFCGIQHAHMQFLVEALPRSEFDALMGARAAASPGPAGAAADGLEVFEANCAACHTVDGVSAVTEAGPDLTHIASRRTLGAGMIDNTPVNLRRWIADPQDIKPGNEMPTIELDDSELDALVEYLGTLE